MAIQFTCPCGKKLQVADDFSGKSVKCPGCSRIVVVPTVEPEAIAAIEMTPATQVWTYPPKSDNFLLALTEDSLWRYSEVFTSCESKRTELLASGDAAAVLGDKALRIPLTEITSLSLDKRRANLLVRYREKNKNEVWVEQSMECFIDQADKRDEIASALTERLGPGWTSSEKEVGLMESVGGYVVCIVLTILAAPVLLWIVHWLQGDDLLTNVPGRLFYRIGRAIIHLIQAILRWGGEIIDWIVIALTALLCVAWTLLMISQIRTPPLVWTLERDKT